MQWRAGSCGGCEWWLCSRETRKCTILLHSNKLELHVRVVAVQKVTTRTRSPGSCSNKNYLLLVHFRGSGCSHDLQTSRRLMSGQKTFLILRKRNLLGQHTLNLLLFGLHIL